MIAYLVISAFTIYSLQVLRKGQRKTKETAILARSSPFVSYITLYMPILKEEYAKMVFITEWTLKKTKDGVQHVVKGLEKTKHNGGLYETLWSHIAQSQEIVSRAKEFAKREPGYVNFQSLPFENYQEVLDKCFEFLFLSSLPKPEEDQAKLSEAELSKELESATQNLHHTVTVAKLRPYFHNAFKCKVRAIGRLIVLRSRLSQRLDHTTPELHCDGDAKYDSSNTTTSYPTSLHSVDSFESSSCEGSLTESLSDTDDCANVYADIADTLTDEEPVEPNPPTIIYTMTDDDIADLKVAKNFDYNKRYNAASKIFKRLADKGLAEAQFYMGYYLYHSHHAIELNCKEGLNYFWEAVKQDHPGAQYQFGRAIVEGRAKSLALKKFGELHIKDGLEYLQRAAEQNEPHAIKYLEGCAKKGYGVAIEQNKVHRLSVHYETLDLAGTEKLARAHRSRSPSPLPVRTHQSRSPSPLPVRTHQSRSPSPLPVRTHQSRSPSPLPVRTQEMSKHFRNHSAY